MRQLRLWSAIGVTMVLSACAGLTAAGRPDPDLLATLTRLQAHREQGQVGSVWGFLYLGQPGVPMPLTNWPVALIPLSPAFEQTLAQARQTYVAGGFSPLPSDALAQARETIKTYIEQIKASGHANLLRRVTTATGADPKFEFPDVPEGRWLLLAELPSPFSLVIWAVPVTITAGAAAKQSLTDANISIEGLTR